MDQDNYRLLYKIAKAYYDDQLTQQEIGDRFGLSRVKVNRLLSRAREERIVQVQIVAPESTETEVERALEQQCGLQEAVIVPSSENHDELLRNLGEGAAAYVRRILSGNEVIGIFWGTSLYAMVEAMSPLNMPDVRIVQMLGGLGDPDADIHGAEIARRFAQIIQARPRMLASPGVVANSTVRDALFADAQISDTLSLAAQADVALVGIGTLDQHSVVLRAGTILSAADVKRLKGKKMVGDIGLRFFDRNGESLEDELNERIIGVTLEQIRSIRRVVAVAGGPEKFDAICGALRGQYLNVLVTDRSTAERLLSADLKPVSPAGRVRV
ncbi:MAG TPA: sugar-binding transcriptional regulator [Spirochaetia bacterium]|nr:sugar-binding transcriptional regulator [Spirochaetia bacterium]